MILLGSRLAKLSLLLDELGDEPGPSSLTSRSVGPAVSAVVRHVKQEIAAAERAILESRVVAQLRPVATRVLHEQPDQTNGQPGGGPGKREELARAGGALDLEVVAVIVVKLL